MKLLNSPLVLLQNGAPKEGDGDSLGDAHNGREPCETKGMKT